MVKMPVTVEVAKAVRESCTKCLLTNHFV